MNCRKLKLIFILAACFTTILCGCSSNAEEDSNKTVTQTSKSVENPVAEVQNEETEKVVQANEIVETEKTEEIDKIVVNYMGHVGTYPIHMSLTFTGTEITGYYSYDSQNQNQDSNPVPNLELIGTANDNYIELFTTDGAEKFTGTLEKGRIYGDWYFREQTLSFVVNDKKAIQPQTKELFKYTGELSLTFASGAGGWSTVLHIFEDGSFEGVYADQEYVANGGNHPDVLSFYSEFKGNFSVTEKLDDYTYVLKLEDIQYKHKVGTDEYRDGVTYVYTTAAGLDYDDDEFILCLPGKPLNELSESVLTWLNLYEKEIDPSKTLPNYALYGADGDEAFNGYSQY